MKILLLEGDTYTSRKDIKAKFSGVWDRENMGWLVQYRECLKEYCEENGFELSEIEVEQDPWNLTEEQKRDRLREARQSKKDKKRERIENKIARLEKEYQEIDTHLRDTYDYSFITQPVTNNSWGRAFAKAKDRRMAKMEKKFSNAAEIQELREYLETLDEPARVKGDAERAREAKKKKINEAFKGEILKWQVYENEAGKFEIKRVNQKSYTILFIELTGRYNNSNFDYWLKHTQKYAKEVIKNGILKGTYTLIN